MEAKIPYYMAYPTPFSYDDERTERLDFEYLKSMYPDTARQILPYVEEECDRMEYENSVVYDQYPDKLQLKLMCRRVYDNVTKHEKAIADEKASLRDLIEVMLYQELYKRRCDNRRRHRRFY